MNQPVASDGRRSSRVAWPLTGDGWRALALFCLLIGLQASANPVLEWNQLLLDVTRANDSSPTLASRNLAILHTAIYDAVNSIDGTHQPFGVVPGSEGEASPEAAAVAAAYTVSMLLYPEHRAQFDLAYQSFLAMAPATAALTNGLEHGRMAGNRSVQSRSADGSSTQVPYIPSDAPGQWRRTPPFFRPPLDPQWGWMEPFCIDQVEEFLPPGPPALESAAYAADFNLTKSLGGKLSSVRTAEQSAIATFWSDFSYTETPPGHWLDIAAAIVQSRGSSLAETARLFALLSMAQADAAVVVWRAKYLHNWWRPVTAINAADLDGNDATESDPNWTSYLPAPPFPEYVSGHSTFSMASAVMLASFYGTDALAFRVGSDAMPGVFRTYDSLSACAAEIGLSRIYAGIHFMSANRDGKALGARLAHFVFENFLLPHSELPLLRVSRADQACTLRVHGHLGRTCVVEGSDDLGHWQSISTNQAVRGGVVLHFPLATATTGVTRFFRVRELF